MRNKPMRKDPEQVRTIRIGPETWVETLPILYALLESGTPKGKEEAKKEFHRMATVADMMANQANKKG